MKAYLKTGDSFVLTVQIDTDADTLATGEGRNQVLEALWRQGELALADVEVETTAPLNARSEDS